MRVFVPNPNIHQLKQTKKTIWMQKKKKIKKETTTTTKNLMKFLGTIEIDIFTAVDLSLRKRSIFPIQSKIHRLSKMSYRFEKGTVN